MDTALAVLQSALALATLALLVAAQSARAARFVSARAGAGPRGRRA